MNDLARLTKAQLIEQLKACRAGGFGPSVTEAALRDAAERLRAILATAVEGIITIDERGIIESFNPAAEKIFGYPAAEVVGQNVNVLMPSPYREEHNAYIENYRRSGHARIIGIGREVVGRRKDGSQFPMDLSVSEVRLADRRIFTGFVRDISERKRLEKEILEISDREQRRIGHDLHDGLCQQLAGIELMSQALEQKIAVRSKSDAARAAEISRLVREAIGYTRSLARGLSPVMLEAEGLMSALHELAANTAKMFRVACQFECDPPVRVHDHSAATHLYRIAQEAVSNAINHGKARRVWIGLKSAGGRHVLSIKDDGCGIPKVLPENQGMGLRIMQYRAGMIGGATMVERDLEGGTSVICSVPRSSADEMNQPHED
ncbi:MAG: PAS domain S-box protein [Verrucomicrobia bacterium]|nr:PAS domain S-box protein [Verrucomicrobiota bacterium]